MAPKTADKRGPVVTPEGKDAICYAVCGYCQNQGQASCLTRCRTEGRYRYLEPVVLEEWDHPPEIPGMGDLLSYDAVTRLALVKLSLHYLREGYIRVQPASPLSTDGSLETKDRGIDYPRERNSC